MDINKNIIKKTEPFLSTVFVRVYFFFCLTDLSKTPFTGEMSETMF